VFGIALLFLAVGISLSKSWYYQRAFPTADKQFSSLCSMFFEYLFTLLMLIGGMAVARVISLYFLYHGISSVSTRSLSIIIAPDIGNIIMCVAASLLWLVWGVERMVVKEREEEKEKITTPHTVRWN
jgi:hypothetical protein